MVACHATDGTDPKTDCLCGTLTTHCKDGETCVNANSGTCAGRPISLNYQ